MNDKPMKVAVVGLGYFSQFHLNAWSSNTATEIVGVTDPNPERVGWAKAQYGATGFASLDALLQADLPNIVDIVAPPPAHADLVRQLIAPNRIIVCQKPFCENLAEARAVADEAERNGTTLIIHENFRFQPWYRTLKSFLDSDGLGQIYQCRFALRPGDGRGEDAYLGRQPAFRSMPRLLIHETGVHFIDLFQWLFGEVTAVYADIRRLNPVLAGEDAGLMVLDHATGVQSTFDGNRLSDHATDNPRRTMGELLVEGQKGTIRLDGHGHLFFRGFQEQTENPIPLSRDVDENSFGGGCVAALIGHVVDAARGAGAYENRAFEYLSVIRATEAAYHSAQDGRKISISMEYP